MRCVCGVSVVGKAPAEEGPQGSLQGGEEEGGPFGRLLSWFGYVCHQLVANSCVSLLEGLFVVEKEKGFQLGGWVPNRDD